MKVLAIGAHPDDIEIFMFGALAAWRVMGAELVFCIATDGSKGGSGDPAELARIRKSEALEAARLLDADLRLLDFPDGELVCAEPLNKALKAVIDEIRPGIVVTHSLNDYHGDHRALAQAVLGAASFAAPVLHADNLAGVGSEPLFYVDITAHAELKAEAIRRHRSQDPERFVRASAMLNRFRAAQCNAPEGAMAEAYGFSPIFPFVDIRSLLPPSPPVRPVQRPQRPAQDDPS